MTSWDIVMESVFNGRLRFNPAEFQARMSLEDGWDWEDVLSNFASSRDAARRVLRVIHDCNRF